MKIEPMMLTAGIFTLVCAFQDIRTRTVSAAMCFIFACVGAAMSAHYKADLLSIVLAAIPGLSLMLFAKCGSWIGMGDGLYYLVLALFMDADHILLLMLMSVPVLAVFALIVLAAGNFRRGAAEKIPYLAVVFPVYCGLWLV